MQYTTYHGLGRTVWYDDMRNKIDRIHIAAISTAEMIVRYKIQEINKWLRTRRKRNT